MMSSIPIVLSTSLREGLTSISTLKAPMTEEEKEDLDLRAAGTGELCLMDEMLCNMIDEKTTTGLWLKLKFLCVEEPPLQQVLPREAIVGLHMKEGSSIHDHLSIFNKLIGGLMCVHEKLKEDDKALLLLNSLLPSYEHLMTTIIYGNNSLEFEDVISMLVSNNIQKRHVKMEESREGLFASSPIGRSRNKDRKENEDCRRGKSKGKTTLSHFCKEQGIFLE